MKQLLLICAVVMGGCGGKKDDGNTGVVNPNKPSPKAVPEKLIADPIVEKAIRQELKKPAGELTKADLEKVTSLNLQRNQLTDVPKGMEKLTQLKYLYLSINQLTDVKGLEKLTQLTFLTLGGNQLAEVKGLENLTQLEGLNLANNQLTDASALANLTQLTDLNLGENKLTDVKGLEKLTQLTRLYLSDNQLTDVKGLEKLTQLTHLNLYDNPALTKAQIDELQKALPNCKISSNPTK